MAAAGALAVAGAGWGISAAGWLISPVMSRLVNDGYSCLGFDASQKLLDLEVIVIPQLRRMLELADRSPHKALLEGWVTKLKSAYYDAEDILDVADYHRLEQQVLSRKIIHLGFRGTLKKTLEHLENIINEGKNFLQLFNLPSNICDGNTSSPHDAANSVLPTTSIPPPRVFGREDFILKIRGILRDTEMAGDGEPSSSSTTCYSVIGIYGIPGSGKTTVAQCVCDEEKDDDYFHPVMWIHVSQIFSVHGILKEMFEAASNETRPEFTNLDMIQRSLELKLRGKRFLLVLDDIWCDNSLSKQKLEQILSPLRVGRRGSKILVTTRVADAARSLGALSPIRLPELDEEGFFKLFMLYATNGARFDEQQQETFETIGRQIIKKLKRSPLAAKMVAGTLSKNLDVGFWRRARDKDLLADSIMGALLWSYQHLDEEVRRCFAYCSIFPRGHLLKCDKLVNLWMAEGFMKISNVGEQIEDIGQHYFNELVSCSFLQQTGRVGDSDALCFTIHDLLYDLAERVAGSDCFTVLESNVEIPPTVRHLYINSYIAMEIAEQICKLENLRTLIFTDIGPGITEGVLDGMLNKLTRLRVVQVKVDSGDDPIAIPASIGNLKHLRCLSIYDKWLPIVDLCLPSTFDKLYHLQILEYSSFDNLRCSCVRSINNLINLRHVKSSSTWDFFDRLDHVTLEIPGIGRLKSLQTLGCFGVRKEKGYELQQLEGLNHLQGLLRISGLGNVESKEQALEAKLADKEGLTSLALEYGGTDECPPDLQVDILEGLRPPSSVTQLRIQGYHSRRYPSWLLVKQNAPRNLQRLQLDYCHELEDLPEIGEIFIHLHELRLERLTSLKSLPRLPENLKKLVIKCCTSLAFICMEDVEMLRTMLVERASQADPSLKSVNPDGIAGFSPDQCDRFKATLYDLIRESGNSNSLSYSRSSYNLMLENVFPLVGGNCIEEDSQLLIPRSVEHLSIEWCTITDSALRNCLIGCTSITCLELSGILCLTAIPLEFLTKLRKLSITECVALTILHGLNGLRNLEILTIKRCPNLKALQDSEKVAALRTLVVDDLSLVPELLSTEGRSFLVYLIISVSKERTEAEFLQQLTSLIFLRFWHCDWDTLPENLVHLTSLEELDIRWCEKMQSLPVLPESLQYFALSMCDPEFMYSCQTHGDPNWQKIEHVPIKIIGDRELTWTSASKEWRP